MFDLLTHDIDLKSLVDAVRTPEQGAELYLAARLAIDPDEPAERAYLDALAARLRLPAELRSSLDAAPQKTSGLKRNRGLEAPGSRKRGVTAVALFFALVRCADARRADEHLFAVGERDVARVGAQRSVLRHEALHRHFRTGRQRVARPAAAQ